MLPTDSKERKGIPVYEGFIKYFPDAIAAVAQCSAIANTQHSGKGAPVQWVKGTSKDEKDALMRHLLDAQYTERDVEGIMHMVKVGWRAFANLQRMADDGINIFAILNTIEEPLQVMPSCVPGMCAPSPITATEILDRRRMYEPAITPVPEVWLEPDVES